MDRFRTEVEFPPSARKIGYHTSALFMGSCFTDEIGGRMQRLKFPVMVNPFGTLFNPASISDNLELLLSGRKFTGDDLVNHQDMWFSLNHYTRFARKDRETCLAAVNESLLNASAWIRKCDDIVITFGTAWSFIYRKTGRLAANCHKLPAADFERRLLKPDEIVEKYIRLVRSVKAVHPGIRFIFTVSPVRHWKDGAVSNQVSKSILLLSIHELLKEIPEAEYFPAYEIFMDELRDYRFYAPDMLHPSESGSEYIWDRFAETFLDEASKKLASDVQDLLRALSHRTRQPDAPVAERFRENTTARILRMTAEHPYLDFSEELKLFNAPL